jgi:uncharacterized protein (TIGR03067 family)
VRTLALAVLLVALAGCSNDPGPTARGPTDRDRFQGVWAVEAVECGVELPPEELRRLKEARLHVHEDRFSLGGGDTWQHYTFAADEGREPKGLLLHETDPTAKPAPTKKKGIPRAPRTKGWLYSLDGDKLVLAFLRGNDSASVPPPDALKAEPGQNVVVLRLAKTNEQPKKEWDAKPAPTK